MNARIKKLWLDALRGLGPTRYRQTKGILRRRDKGRHIIGHCCLGVLSDICVKEDLVSTYDAGLNWDKLESSKATLSPEVGAAVNLRQGSVAATLARMNDSGETFATIADWIERNVPADKGVSL